MKRAYGLGLVSALACACLMAGTSVQAGPETEEQVIQELNGPNPDKVADAMLQLEKQYPTSTTALPTLKKMLTDPRPKVRRKAGRVLGALHAEVNETDLKNICAMLKAADTQEQMDALK